MHLEILVEEPSAEAALRNLLPGIVGPKVTFDVHAFQGKKDLLHRLPDRLRGYSNWIVQADQRIVVLVDADRDDCHVLKRRLERAAHDAGFVTKSSARRGEQFAVLNRIAIEELEAWFFGDLEALRRAYPRVSASLSRQARFRHPDRISGGTWEALERVLQDARYHRGGLRKILAATHISAHMEVGRNTSGSFQTFCDGLRSIAAR